MESIKSESKKLLSNSFKFWNRYILAMLPVIVIGICFALPAVPVMALEDITISDTAYTISAVTPKAVEVIHAPYHDVVYLDKKASGMWVQDRAVLAGQSGEKDLFLGKGHLAAGVYTYRLRQGPLLTPTAVSPDIQVMVFKEPTYFALDKTQYVGKFYTTKYPYSKNTIYYEVTGIEGVVTWANTKNGAFKLELQRWEGTKWKSISSNTYVLTDGRKSFISKLQQTTPMETKYRFSVQENDYVTGGISPEFTVTGKKQTPNLKVKYSGNKQIYGQTSITLTITSKNVFSGKAEIYDGNKRIKTVKVKNGKATYTLSKKLKKGTHKIKVLLKPTKEYKTFYNNKTSAVKKIKVVS